MPPCKTFGLGQEKNDMFLFIFCTHNEHSADKKSVNLGDDVEGFREEGVMPGFLLAITR